MQNFHLPERELVKGKTSSKELVFEVAPPGFEPRQTVPKTVVLPLYYGAMVAFCEAGAKIDTLFICASFNFVRFKSLLHFEKNTQLYQWPARGTRSRQVPG